MNPWPMSLRRGVAVSSLGCAVSSSRQRLGSFVIVIIAVTIELITLCCHYVLYLRICLGVCVSDFFWSLPRPLLLWCLICRLLGFYFFLVAITLWHLSSACTTLMCPVISLRHLGLWHFCRGAFWQFRGASSLHTWLCGHHLWYPLSWCCHLTDNSKFAQPA